MPSEHERRSRWGIAPGQTRWLSLARALGVALAAAAPLALWGSSCVLEGFEKVSATPDKEPPPPDPGPDAEPSPDAGDDVSAVCTPVTYPARVGDDDGPVDDKTFVVAMRSLDFGEKTTRDEWQWGVDFDRTCTCDGGEPSCASWPSNLTHCDGPDGRDMASAELFGSIRVLLEGIGFGSSIYSDEIEQGRWSLLIRVSEYNGTRNDSQVEVAWYVGENFVEANSGAMPSWGGDDVWPVAPSSVDNLPNTDIPDLNSPKFESGDAYVSDGRLVATFPGKVQLSLGAGSSITAITLTTATLIASLGPQPGLPDRLVLTKGTIAGLWLEEDLFKTLTSSPDLCDSLVSYYFVKDLFCGALDINPNNSPASTPCSALSIGIGFETYPAELGAVAPREGDPPSTMTPCESELDVALESCRPAMAAAPAQGRTR